VKLAVPLALVIGVAAINLACMPGEFIPGDPGAWRREAASIVVAGDLSVPAERVFGERGGVFVQNETTGAWYSKYGLMNSLMSLPPMLAHRLAGGTEAELAVQPWLIAHNLWNIALSCALAALLYAAASAYTSRLALRGLFVVAAMYCSYVWFYQRAQNSEIYQVLFFTALFLCLKAFLRRQAWGWLWAAWACVLALVLTRVVYGLLLPAVALFVLYVGCAGRSWPEIRQRAPQLGMALALPPMLIVALLAWINDVKFGAPWLTGYHQWRQEHHWPTGSLGEGLYGFLVSARFSIFLHFPLLILALPGVRRFARCYPLDSIFIYGCLGTFLLYLASLPSWAGEWSYGPRYLIFVLPLASLPALVFAERLLDHSRAWPAALTGVLALAAFGYSAYLQVQVNRLPFFAYYHARVAAEFSPVAVAYFENHVGVISGDLLRHRQNHEALPYFDDFKRRVGPRTLHAYKSSLSETIERGNWFWR
jgi:hypothetical protein